MCAGILIPGGEDVPPQRYGEEPHPKVTYLDPQRDEIEATLITWAFQDKKPCLGLCRGIQIMNVALGGSLFQDLPSMLGKNHYVYEDGDPRSWTKDAHKIRILENTQLASILKTQELNVNSLHHQAIKQIAAGLQVSAEDADGLIEGVESKDHTQFFIGVQCHPESYSGTDTHTEWEKCFSAFIEAATIAR